MALSSKSETQLKVTCAEKLKQTSDPVERLRLLCLSRGANGIRGFSRQFRIMDDDGNKQLSFDEFKTGVQDYGLHLSAADMQSIFARFDSDGTGMISFDEFLLSLRPAMSGRRLGLVDQAFNKLDKTGNGVITIDDLKGVYSVKHHPKYVNGQWTEEQCLAEFLKTFDDAKEQDGTVTKEEFHHYYAAVSSSIDQDPYFDLMMRNSFNL